MFDASLFVAISVVIVVYWVCMLYCMYSYCVGVVNKLFGCKLWEKRGKDLAR